MDQIIGLFPLKRVVFPGEKIHLHIFEPRYKELINDCSKSNSLFGIPSYIDKKPLDMGCLMSLESIRKRYSDGRMDITAKGKSIFKITRLIRKYINKLYPAGHVLSKPIDMTSDFALSGIILSKISEIYKFMKINKPIPLNDANFSSFTLGHHIGLTYEQEYELICIEKEHDRLLYIHEHLTRWIPMVKSMEEMRRKIEMNGHFQRLDSPGISEF